MDDLERPEAAVEPMTEADLDEVLAIERASFPTPWTRESFLFELRENPYARNLVLKDGGRTAAFACVWIVDDELKINNIAVHPDRRGRGFGAVLLRRLIELGRAQGCTEATLEVRPSNRVARALYRAHGFREVGRRRGYYRDTHEDAIVMRLDIAALPSAPP